MNIISICVLALVTAIIAVMIKQKNGEIALMLSISCGVIILVSLLSQVSQIISTVNSIVAVSDMNIEYIKILLKVIGVSFLTEFAVSVCKESGQQGIASNVLLSGKIMITAISLPLYSEILNTVLSITGAT
ncbi:MAG: stage III sporulation AC/AD family protein [Ruminococcus sp.]|nr:stage III sporulation AC/AD family protein [Ruminococcus sp.]